MKWLTVYHDHYLHSDPQVEARLRSVVQKLDLILSKMENDEMATKETLDALAARVQENTDATASARLALDGYVKSTEELTKRLQDALAGDDDAAVKAAADAISANNATLRGGIPVVAAAVGANTG